MLIRVSHVAHGEYLLSRRKQFTDNRDAGEHAAKQLDAFRDDRLDKTRVLYIEYTVDEQGAVLFWDKLKHGILH